MKNFMILALIGSILVGNAFGKQHRGKIKDGYCTVDRMKNAEGYMVEFRQQCNTKGTYATATCDGTYCMIDTGVGGAFTDSGIPQMQRIDKKSVNKRAD